MVGYTLLEMDDAIDKEEQALCIATATVAMGPSAHPPCCSEASLWELQCAQRLASLAVRYRSGRIKFHLAALKDAGIDTDMMVPARVRERALARGAPQLCDVAVLAVPPGCPAQPAHVDHARDDRYFTATYPIGLPSTKENGAVWVDCGDSEMRQVPLGITDHGAYIARHVVLWDGNTLHYGGENRTRDQWRVIVQVAFGRRGMRDRNAIEDIAALRDVVSGGTVDDTH